MVPPTTLVPMANAMPMAIVMPTSTRRKIGVMQKGMGEDTASSSQKILNRESQVAGWGKIHPLGINFACIGNGPWPPPPAHRRHCHRLLPPSIPTPPLYGSYRHYLSPLSPLSSPITITTTGSSHSPAAGCTNRSIASSR